MVRKMEAPDGIWSVRYSKDGKYLAGGGWNDTIKVWDAASGKEMFYRNGHERTVTSVAFTNDGQRLITAGIDQTVRVWGVPPGK
jgi:WD40 repeat protein